MNASDDLLSEMEMLQIYGGSNLADGDMSNPGCVIVNAVAGCDGDVIVPSSGSSSSGSSSSGSSSSGSGNNSSNSGSGSGNSGNHVHILAYCR